MASPSIVWFRDDLRLADNPALRAAVDRGEPVVAVYVLDEESDDIRPLGGAMKWWLHHSLASLGERVGEKGSVLVLRRGPAASEIAKLVAEVDAGAVYWNRRYGGAERAIDEAIKSGLRDDGLMVESFAASMLFEPWTVKTGSGTPFSVFTPFWRACRNLAAPRAPLAEPREIAGPASPPPSDDLADWALLPTKPDWAGGLREMWEPGEPTARRRLHEFLHDDIGVYKRTRDEPGVGSTSQLSPRLRWGEISPYQVWHETLKAQGEGPHAGSAQNFLSEIGWREFACHVLFFHPDLATKNLRREFDAFPWPEVNEDHLAAWRQGLTGVPLVDAGMRELWNTGFMHNRVRMVTASYLIKNLMIDWRLGEQWFWDCLVDGDGASNPFNWQWVAGSGADAAPYFRIFNPLLQQEKFDKGDRYVREWAPEYVTGGDGEDAGVGPGKDAPATPVEPLVDLKVSRNRALDAYQKVKEASRAQS